MQQSESIAKLAAALAASQPSFPVVGKDSTANVRSETGASFSYHYATLPDVQKAVLPILAANGLSVVQGTVDEDDTGFAVETQLLHISGEWIRARVRVPVTAGKNGPTAQAAGSAFAYGRRIGLVGLLGVVTDDTDDDGAAASDGHGEAPAKPHQRQLPPKASEGSIPSKCPKCGGKVWDNRENKKNPKAPDWKCRDNDCKGDDGYVTGGWVEKPKASKVDGGGPGLDSDIPDPEEPDDLPY